MARQRREKSAGEIAAYRMGFDLARQESVRRTRQVRREVRIREDEIVLTEEENWIEESY